MCLICVEISNNKLKATEARRAMGEIRSTLEPQHVEDLEMLINALDMAEAASGLLYKNAFKSFHARYKGPSS